MHPTLIANRPALSPLAQWKELIDTSLHSQLPQPSARPARLHQAMHYSVQAGGKRIRPLLVLAAWNTARGSVDPLPAALAVEYLHTYSLIHDDLPCMDDSPLRRGQPSCHCAFDEATAVLAGDALLTEAFCTLSEHYHPQPSLLADLVGILAKAASSRGLVGGQMEDLICENSPFSPSLQNREALEFIHQNKTAALLGACLALGLRLSAQPSPHRQHLGHQIGLHLGLAFQIQDDILDFTQTSAQLGKKAGLDAQHNKLTAISVYGLHEANVQLEEHLTQAEALCEALGGESEPLKTVLQEIRQRQH